MACLAVATAFSISCFIALNSSSKLVIKFVTFPTIAAIDLPALIYSFTFFLILFIFAAVCFAFFALASAAFLYNSSDLFFFFLAAWSAIFCLIFSFIIANFCFNLTLTFFTNISFFFSSFLSCGFSSVASIVNLLSLSRTTLILGLTGANFLT